MCDDVDVLSILIYSINVSPLPRDKKNRLITDRPGLRVPDGNICKHVASPLEGGCSTVCDWTELHSSSVLPEPQREVALRVQPLVQFHQESGAKHGRGE